MRRKLGCSHQAADIAQDTFLRLLGQRRPLDLHTPRALLAHIAKGLIIDHWRHQEVERAYVAAVAHLPEPQAPSPETRALVIEALTAIDAMLRSMPAKTRDIFLLSQLDGLGLGEIAAREGVSVSTVKRHVRAGLIACMAAV